MPANCTGPMFGSSMTRMPASGPGTLLASSLSTRAAFSRRNFGQTWSRNGTLRQLGEDAVEREPIGK